MFRVTVEQQEWIEAVEAKMGEKLSSEQRKFLAWWVERELKQPTRCDITKGEVEHWAQHFREYNTYIREGR